MQKKMTSAVEYQAFVMAIVFVKNSMNSFGLWQEKWLKATVEDFFGFPLF